VLRWGSTVSVLAMIASQSLLAPANAQASEQQTAPTGQQTSQEPLPTVQVTAPPRRPTPPRRATPARVTVQPVTTTQQQPTQASEPATAASEFVYSGERVNAYPASRPGEVLEVVPGLVITQHSGEGKANQYFLRGFNLDHGTDLAITVDGMPVNMRTHGHGQGYADINFLIPELIRSMQIRKGPYYADEGDFSSAGAVNIHLIDTQNPGLAQGTVGMFGYGRALAVKSLPINSLPGWAGNVLIAVEAVAYNGPWDVPDRIRKWNGVVRYSEGTDVDGFSITGMGYSNRWTSTDQIAERAVASGLIDRFGSLDPSDGGEASRISLSARFAKTSAYGQTKMEAYAIRSTLTLFNNFTYFLDDPVNGDQFSQFDRRTIVGFHGHHTFKGRFGPFESETRVGIQGRFDDIEVGLSKTLQRATRSTVRLDKVQEDSIGVYWQNTTSWTNWFRTIVGLRTDWFWADVASDNPANSGKADASIASPKLGLVFGPFNKTEFFFNAGTGYHSNDVRGVTISVDPNTGLPADRVPFLVRAKGAEVGARTTAIAGLESSVALFVLDYASELLFVGDAGTTEPSRPSRRVGVEWTNHYKPVSWLAFDLDVAVTRARFTDVDPAGDRIPGAPAWVVSGGLVFGEKTGWFGAVKARYFGPRPLIEDNSVRSNAATVVNARLGYKFENGLRIQLDAFNLLNSKDHQIDYYYVSRLPGEPADGVADRHFHPVEPLSLRLTMAGNF
jgi:outer membrane receptor protein involved in Fe transport